MLSISQVCDLKLSFIIKLRKYLGGLQNQLPWLALSGWEVGTFISYGDSFPLLRAARCQDLQFVNLGDWTVAYEVEMLLHDPER